VVVTGPLVQPLAGGHRAGRALAAGYAVLLGSTVAVSVGWLVLGALVTLAGSVPSIAVGLPAWAAEGNGWARGLLAAATNGEPLGQAGLDFAFSALNLLVAGWLLFTRLRSWVTQLLAVAMIGSAAAFNLQAHASAVLALSVTGWDVGGSNRLLMQTVACVAYVVALLMLPAARWDLEPRAGRRGRGVLAAGVGTLVLTGFAVALLPPSTNCILLFGFAVPLGGLAGLARQVRHGPSAEYQTQARLLVGVLLAALVTTVVLGVLTLLLRYLGEPGLMLVDPTTAPALAGDLPGADTTTSQPIALLFYFSRLSGAGIAVAVLVTLRGGALGRAERLFSRGLVSLAVIVLLGGGYIAVSAVASWLPGTDAGRGAMIAAALATALVALSCLPAYLRAERLVDRMLYGRRPTPYRVLADLAALPARGPGEGPDLAGVAEAVGRGLGARSCRIGVLRPGLRGGSYLWSDGSDPAGVASAATNPEEYVTLPIRQGSEWIGSIAVDRGAVAGVHRGQRALLEDIVDSLGAILQASRLGIELERQLRAALAHAEEIALSRRQAVAEMDSERRMIERDLHDGAQHHLVSLRLVLGVVEHEVSTGQVEAAVARLGQLIEQIDTVEAVLAKTVSGMSAITLVERGLAAALTAELAGAAPPVLIRFDGAPDRRYRPDVEAAVYFCCLEAVNNARKHAQGAVVTVCVSSTEGALSFTVRDEGPGFDPDQIGAEGRGRRNLLARMTAVDGSMAVESAPGSGTTVRGTVPARPIPPAACSAARSADTSTGRAGPAHDPVSARAAQPDEVHRIPLAGVAESATSEGPGPSEVAPVELVGPRRDRAEAGRRDGSLLTRLRELLTSARRDYPDGPARDRIDELASAITAPCRIAVSSDAAETVGLLRRALSVPPVARARPHVELVLEPGVAGQPQDARLVVLDGSDEVDPARFSDAPSWPPTVVVLLLRPDEPSGSDTMDQLDRVEKLNAEYQRTVPVLPVAVELGLGAAQLTEADHMALRALTDRPRDELANVDTGAPAGLQARIGSYGVRLAVRLLHEGEAPTPDALVHRLTQLSGLPQLRQLLIWRVAIPAEARLTRDALAGLTELAGSGADGQRLLYQLEQFRSSANELANQELAEALRSGTLHLTNPDRQAAERLLGAYGPQPSVRLGLTADATPATIRQAANERLAHWRQLAAHPAITAPVRNAAELLARGCVNLLDER
jgi:signal transduction histidine kinase